MPHSHCAGGLFENLLRCSFVLVNWFFGRGAYRVAIDPLFSQATSRVVELQRGSGDEKRRQDSASTFLSRPLGPGGRDFAANDAPLSQDDLSAIGGRNNKSGRTQAAGTQGGETAAPDESASPAFLRQAAELVRNDRRSLFASVGFSAQQLAEDGADNELQAAETRQGKSLQAASAYGSVQRRGDGGPPPPGPQVVTESGVLMGFGAFDDLARLDVTA